MSFSDLFAYYASLSMDELQKEKENLESQIACMVLQDDMVQTRLVILNEIIDSRLDNGKN